MPKGRPAVARGIVLWAAVAVIASTYVTAAEQPAPTPQVMGWDLFLQGKHQEADPYFRQVYEARRRSHRPKADVALALAQRGLNMHYGGNAGGTVLLEESITALRDVRSDDPAVAAEMSSLADWVDRSMFLLERTKLYYLESLQGKALDIRKARLGERDALTLESYDALASAIERQKVRNYSERAGDLYRRALDLRRETLGNDHPDVARSCRNLGLHLSRWQKRHQDAEPLLREAVRIRRLVPDGEHLLAQSLADLARNLEDQGRFAEGGPLYAESLVLNRKRYGDLDPDTAASEVRVAWNLDNQQQQQVARMVYQDAIGAADEGLASYQSSLAAPFLSLAELFKEVASDLEDQYRYAEATAFRRGVLAILEKVNTENSFDTQQSMDAVALNLVLQKKYSEAEPYYRRYLELLQKLPGHETLKTTTLLMRDLALTLERQGRFEEAWQLTSRSLEFERKTLTKEGGGLFAYTLESVARGLETRKSFVQAESLLREALALTLADHEPSAQFRSPGQPVHFHRALALNLEAQQRYEEAETQYLKALASYGDDPLDDRIGEGPEIVNDLARMRLSGLKNATAALTTLRQGATSEREWRKKSNGRRSEMSGRLSSPQIELMDANAKRLFLLLADADWERTKEAPQEWSALQEESFLALQDSALNAASLAIAQAGARFTVDEEETRALLRRRQDIARDARMLAERSNMLSRGYRDSIVANTLAQRASEVRTHLQYFDNQVAPEKLPGDRATLDFGNPAPLSVTEVQSLLAPDEGLLLVVPGDAGTHVVAVTREKIGWHVASLTEKQISERAGHLRCGLNPGECPGGVPRSAAENESALARSGRLKVHRSEPTFDRAMAYALYRDLIKPLSGTLASASSLYVVVSGALGSVPLSVLLTAPPAPGTDDSDTKVLRSAPWLIDRFALTSLPAISSLRALRQARKSPKASRPLLAFGDPVLEEEQGSGEIAPSAMIAATSTGLANPAMLHLLYENLPGTRREIEAIRTFLGAKENSVFLGLRATEASFKSAPLASARVIVLSSHSSTPGGEGQPAEPGIVLTPPKEATAIDDGVLTASEVAVLDLNADWVILSSCSSASGNGEGGAESLSALATAFFYAGARSLLVSHWPVRDDVTSDLVPAVLRSIPKGNSDLTIPSVRARALQRAMRAVRMGEVGRDPSIAAHPSAWAAFTLVGG